LCLLRPEPEEALFLAKKFSDLSIPPSSSDFHFIQTLLQHFIKGKMNSPKDKVTESIKSQPKIL
jgi:hypothetical protein